MTEFEPLKRGNVWPVAVVAGVLVLCVLSCVVCVAAQPALQRRPMPFGYAMSFCVVLEGPPQAQVGLRWLSPMLSSVVPPFGGPANGCYIVPWLPLLPPQGEILFPP